MAGKQEFLTIIARKREEIRELELFAQLSERALHQGTRAVEMIDWQRDTATFLGEPSPYDTDETYRRAKKHAEATAAFAKSENDAGQPYLFSTCSVRLVALLEALVDDLVAQAIQEPAIPKNHQILSKLKGPLLEFAAAAPDEQAEYLTETLKQAVEAPLKTGSGRFEALLDPVGLGGPIPDVIRRALCELVQVRNVLMHKGAKADRRLIESCPWLGYGRGDKVAVTQKRFHGYRLAAYWYLVEIHGRVHDRFGEPRRVDGTTLMNDVQRDVSAALGYTDPSDSPR